MNGFFRFLQGSVLVELTSAEPGRALSDYASAGIRLAEPVMVHPLTARFIIPARQWKTFAALAEKRGDGYHILSRQGLWEQIRLKRENYANFFPKHYTSAQIEEDIRKGLELLTRQRERNRDAR